MYRFRRDIMLDSDIYLAITRQELQLPIHRRFAVF